MKRIRVKQLTILEKYLVVACIILLSIVFAVDQYLPLGIATGVLYVFPILLTIVSRKKNYTYFIAIVSFILIIVGYFVSPLSGAVSWMVLVNRFLSVTVVLITASFILNRKSYEKQISDLNSTLEELANTDALTHIGNRLSYNNAIVAEVERAFRYNNSLSLLMFDIDFFKKINDSFGHDVGDEVLINLSKTIERHLRISDYFFRIGGEEFAVILTETDSSNAEDVALSLCKIVSEHNDGVLKGVTISIGVTSLIQSDNHDSILKRADLAMYRSKENGRNQVSVS